MNPDVTMKEEEGSAVEVAPATPHPRPVSVAVTREQAGGSPLSDAEIDGDEGAAKW